MSDFIKHPPTVKLLTEEMKRACDAYLARRLAEQELQHIIHFWALHSPDKLFAGPENLNPTVSAKLGKRRVHLVQKMLGGFQAKLL